LIKVIAHKIGIDFKVLLGVAAIIDFEENVKEAHFGFLSLLNDATNGSMEALQKVLRGLMLHIHKVDTQSIPLDNKMIKEIADSVQLERPDALISNTLKEELSRVQITESEYNNLLLQGAYKKLGLTSKKKTSDEGKKRFDYKTW